MAVVRGVRVTGVVRGVSTSITGVTSVGWSVESVGRGGQSDGEMIITSFDITKWSVSGFIELDELAAAGTLRDAAQEALKVSYLSTDTIPAKTRTFDKISWGGVQSIDFGDVESGGTTTRYRLPFRAVGVTTDTTPADTMTIA